MTLKKHTKNYEILIRFNENGKIGVHKQDISVICENENILSSVLESPEQLTINQLKQIVSELSEKDSFAGGEASA